MAAPSDDYYYDDAQGRYHLVGQQPMSMMTIRNSTTHSLGPAARNLQSSSQSDLLTIRILEASERKMQLIRKLLTPQEYQSIAPNLFTHEFDFIHGQQSKPGHSSQKKSLNSAPDCFDSPDDHEDRSKNSNLKFSKSETNLHKITSSNPNLLLDNLTKRREAIEFFFNTTAHQDGSMRSNDRRRVGEDNLTLELRSGYYLSQASADEDKLIRNFGISSIIDIIIGILGLLGITFTARKTGHQDLDSSSGKTDDEEFMKQFEHPHKCLPYARHRNLVVMRDRLKDDGHFDQFRELKSSQHLTAARVFEADLTEHSELINLARLYRMNRTSLTQRVLADRSGRDGTKFLVVENIGHFNRIHMKLAEKMVIDESGILVYHRIVESLMTKRNQSKQEALKSSGLLLINDKDIDVRSKTTIRQQVDTVSLRFAAFQVDDNKLLSSEEKLAIRLVKLVENFQKLRSKLVKANGRLLEAINLLLVRSDDQCGSVKSYLFKVFNLRSKFLAKIFVNQQETLANWTDLKSVRLEQEFNSTQVTLITNRLASRKLQKAFDIRGQALDKLVEYLNKSIATNPRDAMSLELLEKVRLHNVGVDLIENFEVNSNGIAATVSAKCPSEEMMRRRELDKWLRSLKFKVFLNGGHHLDCSTKRLKSNASIGLDLSASNQINLQLLHKDASIRLQVKLLQRSGFMGISDREIGQTSEIQIVHDSEQSTKNQENVHQLSILLEDGTRGSVILRSTHRSHHGTEKVAAAGRHKLRAAHSRLSTTHREMIDHLYGIFFVAKHQFDDSQTKLTKLLTRINHSWLVFYFTGKQRKYFVMEPFLDKFHTLHLTSASKNECSSHSLSETHSFTSFRLALLAWRWRNRCGQQIFLSDRENVTKLSSGQLEELRLKLSSRSVDLNLNYGYKLIELTRATALDHIRKCELQVKESLQIVSDAQKYNSGEQTLRLDDLLREPARLKVDFSSIIRTVRLLTPRKTARRPLMPRRQKRFRDTASLVIDLNSSLAHLDGQTSGTMEFGATKAPLAQAKDFESIINLQRAAQQRVISAVKAKNLRLVVTIQQATNVPLRVVYNYHPQAAARSQFLSPTTFYPPSPSPTQMPGGYVSSPVPSMQSQQQISINNNHFLVQPTTYVEFVFQRQQLASSLAQGKNPAWNETLFFPVDFDQLTTNTRSMSSSHYDGEQSDKLEQNATIGQLADEYLQLNLFDCRYYLQDSQNEPPPIPAAGLEGSTLALGTTQALSASLSSGPLDAAFIGGGDGRIADWASGNRSLLSAVSQRIERHLIGSLRIPLQTLLATGRIEGSFSLSQPLLLDNYQFEPEPAQVLMPINTGGANVSSRLRDNTNKTHVNLFITLDPPITLESFEYRLPTGTCEDEQIYEYARLWESIIGRYINRRHASTKQAVQDDRPTTSLSSSSSSSPDKLARANARNSPGRVGRGYGTFNCRRHLKVQVMRDEDGKYCLASRFLGPLRPPSEINPTRAVARQNLHANDTAGGKEADELVEELQRERGRQMKELARFVCLLNPLKCGLFQMRQLESNLWFSCKQLLEKQLGGCEEKAVLLCNYFLHLGKCSALLVGEALPAGRCFYVLVWHEQATRFIDSQLQLQAFNLLNYPIDQHQQGEATSGGGESISAYSFIARLPILMNVSNLQLWDPNSGSSYTINNSPLTSVGSIVTVENVYANIQTTNSICDTNFDIRTRQFWFPLFEPGHGGGGDGGSLKTGNTLGPLMALKRELKKTSQGVNWRRQLMSLEACRKSLANPLTLSTINFAARQLNYSLAYQKFSPTQCQELEEAIERAIKSQLLQWRPNRPTYFNRTLSRLLTNKLNSFEARTVSPDEENAEDTWRAELAELIRNEVLVVAAAAPSSGVSGGARRSHERQIVSWPVNLCYTNMKTILDALFASGIHNADLIMATGGSADAGRPSSSISTQFLVAVHVCPYPTRIMSVWLYVGAVINSGNRTNLLL